MRAHRSTSIGGNTLEASCFWTLCVGRWATSVSETDTLLFRGHTTKAVTAQSFVEKAGLATVGVCGRKREPDGALICDDIWRRLPSAAIVYGTLREAGANRYAAEQLQHGF